MTEANPLPPSGDDREAVNSSRLDTPLPPGHADQGREVPGANHEGYREADMVDPAAAAAHVGQDVAAAPDEDTALETPHDGITTLPPVKGFPD
jgi:hypothetical protein